MKHGHYGHAGMNFANNQQQSESEDGFLRSDNTFGAARHVVLDELFKGAVVRTSCGGTTIDLRHTHITTAKESIALKYYFPVRRDIYFDASPTAIQIDVCFSRCDMSMAQVNRWVPVLVVALVLVVAQVMIMSVYTGADYVPAVIDGIATIGWLMALGYLVWFVVGVVSIFQTEVITLVAGILIWIAGSFMVYDIVTRIAGIPYITFASTIPFRLLFGIPTWVAILLLVI